MNIYVIRNGQRFGPYTEQTLLSYVNQGQILVHDKAIRDTDTVEQTAGFYLRQAGLKCRDSKQREYSFAIEVNRFGTYIP